jgi:predicted nucleotidyltransferase
MNLSKIKEGELKEVFDVLELAFKQLGIDFYLIGALARDVWYSRGESSSNVRKTKDVDFAIMIGSKSQYESLRTYLILNHNYQESKENAFVLITPSMIQVDILPFGGIEIDDRVVIEGVGMTSINVNGFSEVFNDGTEMVELSTGHVFKVATLASIILLKLISFDDRPEIRLKDARDIGNILNHFFELENDLMYDQQHADLFQDKEALEKISVQEIASEIAGRIIREIIITNPSLLNRIILILNKHLQEAESSQFVRNMSEEAGQPISEILKWLNKLLGGVEKK